MTTLYDYDPWEVKDIYEILNTSFFGPITYYFFKELLNSLDGKFACFKLKNNR